MLPSASAPTLAYTDPTWTTALAEAALARYPWRDERRLPLAAPQDAASLLTAFGGAIPAWGRALMVLRDRLVGPLGLKTAAPPSAPPATHPPEVPPYAVGQRLGIFRILALGPHGALLGENDQHLDFRILLAWEAGAGGPGNPGSLVVSTYVRPHNAWGRLYLAVVLPWHHLIAGAAHRRLVATLAGARGHD